ncbi:hypothetical protein SAMN05216275_12175 [Streptosporangium canum]|uniref:Uncharacterized protein n=1 Tax=Streptosporangium canum TaxID=324952 RepID=A0A1I3Y9J1_9ACTN|nr:hypothetical protein [Streptosporangium canum]SFK27921.1 hypothetical protein SAMN05216275_12175 [Streptosporangium canum]
MKPSDFLLSARQGFPGAPLVRQVLDVERVTALRNGPLENVPDLEAAQAIICLALSELEAFGTGGAANISETTASKAGVNAAPTAENVGV